MSAGLAPTEPIEHARASVARLRDALLANEPDRLAEWSGPLRAAADRLRQPREEPTSGPLPTLELLGMLIETNRLLAQAAAFYAASADFLMARSGTYSRAGELSPPVPSRPGLEG